VAGSDGCSCQRQGERSPSGDDTRQIKVARQLYRAKELTVEEIARTIGVSRKTGYRHVADTT
jgi:DNA-binding MarR family transcriptional regulator